MYPVYHSRQRINLPAVLAEVVCGTDFARKLTEQFDHLFPENTNQAYSAETETSVRNKCTFVHQVTPLKVYHSAESKGYYTTFY